MAKEITSPTVVFMLDNGILILSFLAFSFGAFLFSRQVTIEKGLVETFSKRIEDSEKVIGSLVELKFLKKRVKLNINQSGRPVFGDAWLPEYHYSYNYNFRSYSGTWCNSGDPALGSYEPVALFGNADRPTARFQAKWKQSEVDVYVNRLNPHDSFLIEGSKDHGRDAVAFFWGARTALLVALYFAGSLAWKLYKS